MASLKEVMNVMLPQLESMIDRKMENIQTTLSEQVAQTLKDNGMLNPETGSYVPELKTASDAKLDQLTVDILEVKSKNPTAGLVMVKGRNGRTTVMDTYSDVLADIKDEQDGRFKMRRKSRIN
tara:strand:+ start:122 stop:490 length:369 start_codon:yes stop_codon:yes gene_type:complete